MAGIPALVLFILAVSVSCIHAEGTNESKPLKPEGRIIGGQDAMPNEFPHQIQMLQIKKDGRKGEFCGASLLSSEWILTAAHCTVLAPDAVDGLNSFKITAGRHLGFTDPSSDPGEQVRTANETFIHPCFDKKLTKEMNNDIALIKLNSPFTLNDKVKIIQFDEKDRAKPGTEATVIGWGRIDSNPKGPIASVLKKFTTKLPAAGICSLTGEVHEQSQQCVNELSSSSCSGDSGGPLLCKDGGVNYLCGIVSFGEKGITCIGGYSVLARVFYFSDWIKDVMGSGCNSLKNCAPLMNGGDAAPKTPLPACNKTEGMNNESSTCRVYSAATSTTYEQSQHGFYFRMILITLLFAY